MKNILAILAATVWISFSEFVRNEWLLKHFWVNHYEALGLEFPSAPVNGMIWGVWSLCLALGIFFLIKRLAFWLSAAIAWWMGFVMMWLVTGNMMVLPLGILPYAIPLSLLEVAVAAAILRKLSSNRSG